LKNKLKSP